MWSRIHGISTGQFLWSSAKPGYKMPSDSPCGVIWNVSVWAVIGTIHTYSTALFTNKIAYGIITTLLHIIIYPVLIYVMCKICLRALISCVILEIHLRALICVQSFDTWRLNRRFNVLCVASMCRVMSPPSYTWLGGTVALSCTLGTMSTAT